MTALAAAAFTVYVIYGLVWPLSLPPTRRRPEPNSFEYWPGFLHELEISR